MRLRIERMTPEGQGLGRPVPPETQDRDADAPRAPARGTTTGKASAPPGPGKGKVTFVPYAAPGDLLEVSVERARSGYAQGRIREVLEPGPARIEPRCPLHYRPGGRPDFCGGCDWQHLTGAAQLEAKRELVRDCLFRIAKLRTPMVEPVVPSPSPWRYRNKVLVPFGRGPRGGIVAGFYSPGSHRIAGYEDCLVQPEASVRMTLKVRELAEACGWPVYDEHRSSGWLRHLYVRTDREGRMLAALVTRTPEFRQRERCVNELRAAFPELVGLHQNVQPLKTPVVLGKEWRRLWGAEKLEERIGSARLLVSPAAFLQVNTPACEKLYGLLLECLRTDGFRPELALDLYSGVGSIALWLAPHAGRVLGIEENRQAVADAWENARLNRARNVRFQAGSVETQSGRIRRELERLELGSAAAVLDPPRAGCTKPVLKSLLSPALRRVVYVSCNPATFARDADWLSRHRWSLRRVAPVDLFPQTSHVELVGLFERADRTPRQGS